MRVAISALLCSSAQARRTFFTHVTMLCTLGALGLLAMPAAATDGAVEPKADVIAQRSLDAMGGADAWKSTRFIRFDFFGARSHHWDRYTGRHRLEGESREGDSYVVLHNINSREGRAWKNGEEVEGEELESWLERAYGAWINDTYWLLMPYKLRDPGVTLSYDGEEQLDDTTYDKLKLTFGDVGLTPGDTYWAFIDQETGLMGRWAFHLQDWPEDREPSHWQWLDWADYGAVKLSPRRVNLTDDREAMLDNITVYDALPDSVFESHAAVE